jgi:hypothetical protein
LVGSGDSDGDSTGISCVWHSPQRVPIELWSWQLKAFLRQFSPSATKMVDILLATAIEGVNPKHFKNWFTSCCYFTL